MPEEKLQGYYLVMATRQGIIKRTELSEFANLRKSGLIAIVLREDDDLIGVAAHRRQACEVLLGTRDGMSHSLPRDAIMRPIGRNAMGVRAIELAEGDQVVAMCHRRRGHRQVLSITENGLWQAHRHRGIPPARAAAARASRP